MFTIIMGAVLVSCFAGIAYCHRKQDDQSSLMDQSTASTMEFSVPSHFIPEDDLPSYDKAVAPPTFDDAVRLEVPEDMPQRP